MRATMPLRNTSPATLVFQRLHAIQDAVRTAREHASAKRDVRRILQLAMVASVRLLVLARKSLYVWNSVLLLPSIGYWRFV